MNRAPNLSIKRQQVCLGPNETDGIRNGTDRLVAHHKQMQAASLVYSLVQAVVTPTTNRKAKNAHPNLESFQPELSSPEMDQLKL